MEKFGNYKFRLLHFEASKKSWYYQIMNDDESIICQSKELFAYEGIARFAAIGHIALIEQGKV